MTSLSAPHDSRAPGSAAPLRGIPVPLTSLVGREQEIDAIRRLLAGSRLLTVTGTGGSGKTRLALEVLTREARAGVGGVWVELATVRDAALVPDAVLSALGVRDQSESLSSTERLVETIGDRALLLVLDNCEHLVDACAALADGLLRGCPALRVVATSREALGVTGETAWLVPPLSLPAADGASTERSEAVQLFVERARAVKPTFALGQENRRAVVDICRRLDGLPLALELAAARLRALTPEQIAARLDDRFQLLTTGNRAALPRHQTLRAAIDWSYELLEPRERRLLARLAVFAGGFTLEAAESVCGDGDVVAHEVLDIVSELVEKSLVQMSEAGDTARYRLLETVRQYAAERLAAEGELEALQRRHADFFAALVAEAEPHLVTPRRPAWVSRLEADADNIRQVLAWSRAGDEALHVRLVGMLLWYWFATGSWPEAREWFRSALTVPAGTRPTRDRAAVLFAAGAIASLQARNASALVHLLEAETLAASVGDERLLAYVRNYMAMAYGQVGDPAAEEPLQRARRWFREAGDLYGLRLSFLLESSLQQVRGDIPAAVEAAEEGVRIARVFGLDRELAMALQILGMAVTRQGDHARAMALFRDSVECVRRDSQPLFLARALELVAAALVQRGATADAARLYGAAAAHREATGARMWKLDADRHGPAMATGRAALGNAAWDAAYASGGMLSTGEAIDFALDAAARDAGPDRHEPTRDTAEYRAFTEEDERPARPALRVRALGPLEIALDDATVPSTSWRSAKVRELLVLLLCFPEGRTREQIGLALWPDASTAQVRNNFHVTLHHLRRTLGHAEWVAFDRERYRLDVASGIDFDAVAFDERMVDALRRARRGPVDVDALQAALALHRGPFLEGEPAAEWHDEFRDRVARLHAEGLETLGDALLAAERWSEAAPVFERLVRQEELHEAGWRGLMTARARMGDRAGALREFRRLEVLLQRELASAPDARTQALARELQRS